MSEPKAEQLTEGWFTFNRYYCKEGFIDRWLGDMSDNPNLEKQSDVSLRAFHQYFRLNGKGEWVAMPDLTPEYVRLLIHYREERKSIEIWRLLHEVNAI